MFNKVILFCPKEKNDGFAPSYTNLILNRSITPFNLSLLLSISSSFFTFGISLNFLSVGFSTKLFLDFLNIAILLFSYSAICCNFEFIVCKHLSFLGICWTIYVSYDIVFSSTSKIL